jgi:hypothetical protein
MLFNRWQMLNICISERKLSMSTRTNGLDNKYFFPSNSNKSITYVIWKQPLVKTWIIGIATDAEPIVLDVAPSYVIACDIVEILLANVDATNSSVKEN